jgi:hypothetical protein
VDRAYLDRGDVEVKDALGSDGSPYINTMNFRVHSPAFRPDRACAMPWGRSARPVHEPAHEQA